MVCLLYLILTYLRMKGGSLVKVLLVEDEEYIAEAVEQILKKNKYSVDLAYDGKYGRDCAVSNIYDIIILDIMLPEMDGITVLRRLREDGIKTPVLMLTAKGQLKDKGVVFVYITNGSSPQELWNKKINSIPGEHYYIKADEWDYLM